MRQQPKEFYAAGIGVLIKRWDKCINVGGDYVNKIQLFPSDYPGYPFNLQVYVGKEAAAEDKTPIGTRVVLVLIECVENCRRHKVYVDNFFNSLPLLEEMRKCDREREPTAELSFTR
ncbi:hypothetical protein AVEN_11553-1 [Araneus ventricosus]|uniref:PiggyBac transposable element-derived protein domain-containing protein n=1 Tax=Araneus ventricosus TaxID=182803 RepID=A0A4Y2TFJ7_ARAVE|nr:hypothetical protein AVEN_11553-1 [Araneus ventricosus]